MKSSIKLVSALSFAFIMAGTTYVSAYTSGTGGMHDYADRSAYHSILYRDTQISDKYGGKVSIRTETSNYSTGSCSRNYATGYYSQTTCTTAAGSTAKATDVMTFYQRNSHYHSGWSN